MRKFIVFVMALFAFGTATAETMCVKLDASKACNGLLDYFNAPEFRITCDDVKVTVMAFLSDQGADNWYDKSDALTASNTFEENKYCWCKMISPALSPWVFSDELPKIARSIDNCMNQCLNEILRDSAYGVSFRSALFSDLY